MSSPEDPLEHEADRAADAVMRIPAWPDAFSWQGSAAPIDRTVQSDVLSRKCSACEQEEQDEQVYTKAGPGSGLGFDPTLPRSTAAEIARERAAGGSTLAPQQRRFFEPRFGQSFEHVRLHIGSSSDRLAESLGARAFTVGSDLFFRQSEFRPETRAGQQLLAHELAHTIQQQGKSPTIQRAKDMSVDPLTEITAGRVTDSYALLDLLRGMSNKQLRSTRKSLKEYLDSGDASDQTSTLVESAIEEINAILTGTTTPITLSACEEDPSAVPATVWTGNERLAAVKAGDVAPLRVGEQGFHVELVQAALRHWGCKSAIPTGEYLGKSGSDGVFGRRTRYAVQEFQRQHDLPRDGRVGPQTLGTLEEAAVVVDTETDASRELTCPPRTDDERGWDKTVPLSITSTTLGEESGYEVRKWVISGFPIDSGEPLASQGRISSLLKPVLLRLGRAGLKWEPPEWAAPKGDYCNEFVRFVAIFGAGDCHAPEQNVHLKITRSFAVEKVWPEKFGHLLRVPSEAEKAAYEARFGEFPAGTNATKEARAGNRGVVLLEMIDRGKRDPKETERERTFLRSEVHADFEELFEAAQARVKHSLFQCILSKVRFKNGLPVNTPLDEFIMTREEAQSIQRNKGPKKSWHLGENIHNSALDEYGIKNNSSIWIPEEFDAKISICGQDILPPADPEQAMFDVISQELDRVDAGKGYLHEQIQAQGDAQLWWLKEQQRIGAIFSCYPDRKPWQFWPAAPY